jgi:hypothetical protein
MPDENSEETTATGGNVPPADVDILGGLESLLEEEGSGFDLPDDELTENDISDLFSEDSEDASEDPVVPPVPSRTVLRATRGARTATTDDGAISRTTATSRPICRPRLLASMSPKIV